MHLSKGPTTILTLFMWSWTLAGCGGHTDPVEEESVPPSLILISLDTLRYDHCGFNGYERDTTPFLDRFASESIAFDRAYTTMSWTLIAHMSMLTGLFPSQHGVLIPQLALTADFPTLAERLHAEGYATSGIYSCGWVRDRFGFARGFDSYDRVQSAEEADVLVRESMDSMRPDFPFFQFIHLFDIHSGSLGRKDSTIYGPPAPYDSLFVEDAKERLAGIKAMEWWNKPVEPTPEQHEAVVALYDGGVRYVDSVLEGWFTEWEKRGLLDNTIVVITSDHGEGLRDRLPRYGGHGDLYEEGLRIPMLIRLPGGERGGERSDHLTSLVDIVPTVLDLAGLAKDDRLPGFSAVGPHRPESEWIFAANNTVSAAVSRSRKILYRDANPNVMFDLESDREERNKINRSVNRDLFLETAQPLLDAALIQLGSYFKPNSPVNTNDLSEEAKSDLRGLGYGGEVDGK